MDNKDFFKEIRAEITAKTAMIHHPFIKKLVAGELTREQLRGWAKQFWVIPHTHLINNAGKLAHAQLISGSWMQQLLESPYDHGITSFIGESVADEMGKTAISSINHYDCFFDLTEELGIPRPEVGNFDGLLPTSLVVMHSWTSSALHFSLLELLSSHNLVNDPVNVIAYPPICQALQQHYGLSKKASTWFDLHGEVDKEHGSRAEAILSEIVTTEEHRRVVRYCVKFGLGIKWTLFDGVMDAYVTGHYPH
ncbi:MAG: TenA family transcriptional regulator [Chloroflexota bacterium]